METERRDIHISDVRLFKKCRQWWHFASPLRMNLESANPNKNLWLGTGVHVALAAYYDPKRNPTQPREASVLLDAYSDWYADAEGRLAEAAPEVRGEILQELGLGFGMLKHYSLWARTHDQFDVLATEMQISVALPIVPGYHVYVAGTADGMIVRDGETWLVEWKTTSQFPDLNTLLFDEQCMAYLWMARQLADLISGPGEFKPPRGTLYTFLRKKAPTEPKELIQGGWSQAKNIDSTFEAYLDHLKSRRADLKRYQDVLYYLYSKPNTFFIRAEIERSDKQLRVFAAQLSTAITEMLDPALGIYPAPEWFKCRFCPFSNPCSKVQAGVSPQPILTADYTKRAPRWHSAAEESEQ